MSARARDVKPRERRAACHQAVDDRREPAVEKVLREVELAERAATRGTCCKGGGERETRCLGLRVTRRAVGGGNLERVARYAYVKVEEG